MKLLALLFLPISFYAQSWIPDLGNGKYKNPVIYADYSDPDVIRVGDDYYMTSSSFSHFPGLPILHSKDLVNWELIGHAVQEYPIDSFNKPQHGNGIWAPSIRYHNNEFYIYFGDPDNGIFMTKAKNPAGPWEPLKLIRKAKGWIDPCPLWDDDGNTYLVHAWARSRSGIKHIITINKMNSEGTEILDDGVTVFCDSLKHPTIEGPKFYKRKGYYYIFAPAGGVKPGWQVVLRSKNIYGPYEDKIVLEQGSTDINGPHQGGWVETPSGESWFIHFQDREAYGRMVHLEPMKWEDTGWLVMGEDYDGNGIGEPVSEFKKPDVGEQFPLKVPATTDEFNLPDSKAGSDSLGLQWQWQSNFSSDWISFSDGELRFHSQTFPSDYKNLWNVGSLLLQKFPAPEFTVTTKLEFHPEVFGEKAGLIIFGLDYSYIGIEKTESGYKLLQVICKDAEKGTEETVIENVDVSNPDVFLKVSVIPSSSADEFPSCSFSYSADGNEFKTLGNEFTAKPGKWVGAKVGIFSAAPMNVAESGYTDFDWFRFIN